MNQKKTKRGRRRRRDCPGQLRFYETRLPLSDEHYMRMANQAVTRANIPPSVMSREECLESALCGIAIGWERYNEDAWQSSFEWLSMQAYYQIKNDYKKRLRELQMAMPVEDFSWIPSSTLSPQQEIEREEQSEAVSALLSVLPRLDRAIVKRIAIHGDNWKRVAKRFRLWMGEVKKRYFGSLEKLRIVALAAAEASEDAECK